MTLFFVIAFKESEVSGEILDVYMALRFYLCMHLSGWWLFLCVIHHISLPFIFCYFISVFYL